MEENPCIDMAKGASYGAKDFVVSIYQGIKIWQ
jgi:hypothetical protein